MVSRRPQWVIHQIHTQTLAERHTVHNYIISYSPSSEGIIRQQKATLHLNVVEKGKKE